MGIDCVGGVQVLLLSITLHANNAKKSIYSGLFTSE